jgi:hypothetical protein
LLDVHSRYGLPARWTAKRPMFLEGFDGFVTSTAAPIATGWSDLLAGRGFHPLKIRTFPRRTTGFVRRHFERIALRRHPSANRHPNC